MQFTKKILALLLLTIFSHVNAQITISGRVVDKKGEPIVGANIYLENTYDGATTDIDGKFTFTTNEVGEQTLVVSNLNFKTYRQTTDVARLSSLRIILNEAVNTLDAVVLSAGSFRAGGTTATSVMSPLDVVTTAGVAGDFIGALQTLPGTQTVGEDGRLFVRGGTADETGVYIDGLQVFKPYISTTNNSPTRGRYSPFLFDGITFSTGGYSAEYGNALSSVLLLNTINQPKQNETNISLISLGVGVGHTKKWEKDALTINASYINLGPYNKIAPDRDTWNKLPESFAGEAVYRHNTKNGLFKFYSAYDFSKFDVEQENINYENRVRFKLKDSNWYTNLSYDGFIGDDLKLTTGLSYSNSNTNVGFENTDVNNIENAVHLKAKLKHSFSNAFKLSYGAELTSINFKETGITNQTENLSAKFTHNMSSAFTEAEIFFSNNFAGKFGVRGDYNALLNQTAFSPRISLAYKLSNQSQLSLAYGDFYQTPQQNELKIEQNLGLQKATHYILNYQYKKNRQLFRAEIYYKDYNNLLQYDTEFDQPSANFSNNGFGYAKGLDLFWKDSKNIKNLQYWLSYSYLDTERKYRDFRQSVTPSFANTHNASLVTKYWINDWRSQVGATYTFASGRPYDNPNSNNFMDGKTKTYNNFSVNWSYLISQQKILFISVSNILGIKNTYGYNYANTPDANGMFQRQAIIPSADRFFFVGFFWTISDDKSKNQLDNL
ncbi:TonB-dependent receptor [Aureibaculum sp. 2210JD6-5]|uniref:TonB-dependent receptor n=1 Tax=Aureibaculum sp. 2210JD6-5 TaxID=3103957 RepID=UPI002AAD1068|nr:TonB-dependent receptor [Aureibaculum sp. 2210JD6-5]MDY7395522.1 TonB-dependent receptor [Aureibaculum sp. 2210JD6-5]